MTSGLENDFRENECASYVDFDIYLHTHAIGEALNKSASVPIKLSR